MPGQVIDGRYVVDELLGRGGMAEVYRARDTEGGRCVALKVLRGVEPQDARRFRSEVDVLARLNHPGLVRLCGSGTHDGVPYLVLDLAEGPTLAHELAAGPLPRERAVAVAQEVAEALAHAHRIGVVHRDVKPSNILCDEHGRARLADFGIARLEGAPSVTRTGQMVGSAPYLAPKQVEGGEVGPPADVYALGLVLIECLNGRPCYPGGQLDAAVARLRHPPAVPDGTPQWLGALLTAMTERNPDRRPSAAAVAEALRDHDVGPILAATQAHPAPSPDGDDTAEYTVAPLLAPRHPRRSPLAAAALVAAALLAVAAWAAGRDDGSPTAPPPTSTPPATAVTTGATTAATTAPAPHGPREGGKHEGGNGRGHRD